MVYKTICGHEWDQVSEHRYKCKWCGAIGYTKIPLPGAGLRSRKIYIYRCTVKGCKRPAVVVRRNGNNVEYQRCDKHNRKELK